MATILRGDSSANVKMTCLNKQVIPDHFNLLEEELADNQLMCSLNRINGHIFKWPCTMFCGCQDQKEKDELRKKATAAVKVYQAKAID